MLDADLAALHEVETRRLNEAVRRNRERFPDDFIFQLSPDEENALRSQLAISNEGGRGGRRYRPYAFTEQGIAMLSSVPPEQACHRGQSRYMRTLVRLRQLLATHEEIARRLEDLEWRQNEHEHQIEAVFETIQHLIEAPEEDRKKRFGFPTSEADSAIED